MTSMDIRDYAAQEAANQPEKQIQAAIVEVLRFKGYAVYEFAKPGGHVALRGAVPVGWPDLLVGRNEQCCGMEVKRPGKTATVAQQEQAQALQVSFGIPVHVVHSVDEALEAARHML